MKIDFKKIKKYLLNFLTMVAKHVFMSCLVLFVLASIIGAYLFYKCIILAQKIDMEDYKFFQIREEFYNEILLIHQKKAQRLKETNLKEYLNPFSPRVEEPQEES